MVSGKLALITACAEPWELRSELSSGVDRGLLGPLLLPPAVSCPAGLGPDCITQWRRTVTLLCSQAAQEWSQDRETGAASCGSPFCRLGRPGPGVTSCWGTAPSPAFCGGSQEPHLRVQHVAQSSARAGGSGCRFGVCLHPLGCRNRKSDRCSQSSDQVVGHWGDALLQVHPRGTLWQETCCVLASRGRGL